MPATKPIIKKLVSCACGAVSVAVDGPVLSMLLCTCLDCQKASGSGHASVAMLSADRVHIAGETTSFTRTAASGAQFTRSFCPHCGTPIAGASSRAPAVLLLPAGLFAGDTDWFSPSQVIFARSHADWNTLPPDLVQHQTYRDSP